MKLSGKHLAGNVASARSGFAFDPWGAWLGLLVLLGAGCAPADKPPAATSTNRAIPVTVAPAQLLPMDRSLTVVGTLYPKEEAVVGAEVEGRVETIKADLGDRIEPGQELAQIDTASYEAAANLAAANLTKAEANLANAEANLRRNQELRNAGIASMSELDVATAQAGQWRADVKAQEAANAIARLNLSRSRVKAPFTASVAERLINAGDFVRVGTPLYRVVNDTELKLVVQVPERYAGDVKMDQMVRFTVDAFPNEVFEGKVFLISPAVNLTSRAFVVAARMSNSAGRLKASTFARGELILATQVPTVVAPLTAVQNYAGVTRVFVIQDNVARSREIQVGKISDGRQEILGGLKPGELVAISGQTKLFDQAPVRTVSPEDGAAGVAKRTQSPTK
jgi:membrane fusion protein (multidrug efflux system)